MSAARTGLTKERTRSHDQTIRNSLQTKRHPQKNVRSQSRPLRHRPRSLSGSLTIGCLCRRFRAFTSADFPLSRTHLRVFRCEASAVSERLIAEFALPCYQGICREFLRFPPDLADLDPESLSSFSRLELFPCSERTGISFSRTGNSRRRTGNSQVGSGNPFEASVLNVAAWSCHASGMRVSTSACVVKPMGCRPSRMAFWIAGERKASFVR